MKRVSSIPAFDRVNGRPVMCFHDFEMGDDGILRHWVDGNLRAEVPREGFESYAESWPDAKRVLANEAKAEDNSGSGDTPAPETEVSPAA